jgi:hypothetical protein
MSTPPDPSANMQAHSDRHGVELLKNELAPVLHLSTIATRDETGNQESAELQAVTMQPCVKVRTAEIIPHEHSLSSL